MDFQTKVKKQLQKEGFKVLKVVRLSENGYPDLLALKNGMPNVWIEIKKGKDTLKPLQKLRIDYLNSIDNIALCIHDSKGIIYGDISLCNTLKVFSIPPLINEK